MGNRAVIEFVGSPVGIYLHWNGGRNSVEAFLDYARLVGVRRSDPQYLLARLTQIIGNYIDGSVISMGVGLVDNMDRDNYDNGVYLVGDDLQIVDRLCVPSGHTEQSAPPNDLLFEEVRAKNDRHFCSSEELDSKGRATASLIKLAIQLKEVRNKKLLAKMSESRMDVSAWQELEIDIVKSISLLAITFDRDEVPDEDDS